MSKAQQYVNVAPAVPLAITAKSTYTYQLPLSFEYSGELLHRPVIVPWRGRSIRGVIMAVHRRPPVFQTQPVRRLATASLTVEQVAFARWIAHTMQGGLGYTLRLFLPPQI